MEIREITYLAIIVRILAAVLIGGLLGLERGMKHRPAGLRTYMLVCVGSCMIMLTNQYIYQVYGAGDPVRMGAQVVSGIGFLGAGTIVVTRRSQIKGLTTAAGLWTAAAVGLALGIGLYEVAVVGAMAIFVVITLLQKMDSNLHKRSNRAEVYVELTQEVTLGDFLKAVRDNEIEVSDVLRESGAGGESGTRAYTATLKGKKRQNHQQMLDIVLDIPGVSYIEEL
ncbi:MAG: MgtC/SapB family protein [Oscillospiraceae bacterium]|nr:MgtC/SapB family protein [Oscillospiraceae bacterium]